MIIVQEHDPRMLLDEEQGNWSLPLFVSERSLEIGASIEVVVSQTRISAIIRGLVDECITDNIHEPILFADVLDDDLINNSQFYSFIEARRRLKEPVDREILNCAVEYWYANRNAL